MTTPRRICVGYGFRIDVGFGEAVWDSPQVPVQQPTPPAMPRALTSPSARTVTAV